MIRARLLNTCRLRRVAYDEIRKLISAPHLVLGSVLGPDAVGAGRLILVIGSQKIVRDLDEAMRRIESQVFPYEDAQVHESMQIHTFIGKIRIIRREWIEGRVTVNLVREPVGI